MKAFDCCNLKPRGRLLNFNSSFSKKLNLFLLALGGGLVELERSGEGLIGIELLAQGYPIVVLP